MGGTPFELSGVIVRDNAMPSATQRVMRSGKSRLGNEHGMPSLREPCKCPCERTKSAQTSGYAMLVPDHLLPRAIGMIETPWLRPLSSVISPELAAFRRFHSHYLLPFFRGTVFWRRLPPWMLKTTGRINGCGAGRYPRRAEWLRNGQPPVQSRQAGPRIGRAHAPRLAAAFRNILGWE